MTETSDIKAIRILIADRHPLVRRGLCSLFALEPGMELVREQQPGLLVIDCNLLEEEILALLCQVKEEWPHVRCLVLTQTVRQRNRAIAAGADAVLPRDGPSGR